MPLLSTKVTFAIIVMAFSHLVVISVQSLQLLPFNAISAVLCFLGPLVFLKFMESFIFNNGSCLGP